MKKFHQGIQIGKFEENVIAGKLNCFQVLVCHLCVYESESLRDTFLNP